MTKLFDVPFAENGDKSAVPDLPPQDGTVSYSSGYGNDYTVDPANGGRRIEQESFNQVMNDVTGVLKEVQENGLLQYRPDANYVMGALSRGSDNLPYIALQPNGPASTVADPTTSPTFWQPLLESGGGSFGGTGNNVWSEAPASQGGFITEDFRIGNLGDGVHTITFPRAFSGAPYSVLVNVHGTSDNPTSFSFYVNPDDFTATNFVLEVRQFGFNGGSVIAVGPGPSTP